MKDSGEANSVQSSDSWEPDEGLTLSIKSFTQLKEGHFCCVLSTDDGETLSIRLKARIPAQTFNILQLALDFQNPGKNRPCKSRFSSPFSSDHACRLRVEIFWKNADNLSEASSYKENDILALLINQSTSEVSDAWSPRDFYESVYVPEKENKEAESLVVDDLESTLFPYQKRTVQWMLRREGVDLQGRSFPKSHAFSEGDHGFVLAVDHRNNPIWVNPWLGLVTTNHSLLDDPAMTIRGVSLSLMSYYLQSTDR